MLQVDANAAYTLDDADHLAQLDAFDLLLVEQPLAADDLRHHSLLAKRMRTPICLDESITSAKTAADAIALGACSIVNIKAGRVGGYLEAKRVHDMCQVHGVPVWCGGMLETGLGRAANLALAALPGFTLPGDTSASDRYWERDLTTPFVLDADGHVAVPSGPGLGVEPLPDVLADGHHVGALAAPLIGESRAMRRAVRLARQSPNGRRIAAIGWHDGWVIRTTARRRDVVLFDLDGTLSHSEPGICGTLKLAHRPGRAAGAERRGAAHGDRPAVHDRAARHRHPGRSASTTSRSPTAPSTSTPGCSTPVCTTASSNCSTSSPSAAARCASPRRSRRRRRCG